MAFHSRPGLGAKHYHFWPIPIPTPRWWDNATPAHPLYPLIRWMGTRRLTRSDTHLCYQD